MTGFRIQKLLRVLRRCWPEDPTHIGASRYRRALMSSGALVLARATTFVSMLLLVPMLLTYLDYERFGLWMTFSSIAALMTFVDFGLGNGLMTTLAAASAKESNESLRTLISSGFAALVLLATPLILLIAAVSHAAPLSVWLGTTNIPAAELRSSITILALGGVAGSIVGIAARVQSGLQTGYIASMWSAASSLLMFVSVMAGIYCKLPFIQLVAIGAGVPIVIGAANTIWYFTHKVPALRPNIAAVDRSQIAGLFRIGCLFFLLQVAAAVTFATDNLIIAASMGVEAVPAYAIPARLFGFISLAVAIVVQPLWPAYAEAAARGDTVWVRKTFLRSLGLAGGLSVVVATTLFLLRDSVFPLWTGSQIKIDSKVAAALTVWCVAESCGVALAMLLNGLKVVRFQVAIAFAHTILSLPVRYFFLHRFGLWGLPVATTVVYVATAIIPCLIHLPRILGVPSRVAAGQFDSRIDKVAVSS
jgi:O-antigen/teichoic acid export membrane protein